MGKQRIRRPGLAVAPLLIASTIMIGTFALPAAVTQAANICNTPYDLSVNIPADFKDANSKPFKIDNPYFPLDPGTTFVYQGTNNEQEVVQVTHQKKIIQGVTATVVRDEVRVDGELAELTFDWYAQDKNHNVWYFGEDSKEYEDGKVVSTFGSWEAGVNGAKPGIIMEANPKVGDTYRQEFAAGIGEDWAEVRDTDADVSVPYGSFDNVLQTRDGSCIESGTESKYYAAGVGLVLELGRGKERIELVSVTH